ncbi:MAG: ATP-binding protein [Chloroflexi bacterium]|nr:ATP-binding protein [Chloroflexota bacterium]
MANPFRYGTVATGEYFTNRLDELSEIEADIRQGQNVVVISPRRFGKTSLISQAIEHLKQKQVLIAYLDLFRTPTKERFADHLADAIYDGLVAPFQRFRQRATDIFQKLPIRPRITINPDGTPSFEFGAGERSRDIDRTIEELLALPGSVAKARKQPVALVLDEFQEVVELDPHLPALMRAVFQVQTDVSHVFLGSKRHLMRRVFVDENEPMYKLAKPLVLREIKADDFAAFIRDRFAQSGRRISDDATQRILEISDCHPHDTQELCYFTWFIAATEGTEATPDVVERALHKVIEAEDARCTDLWDRLSGRQRIILAALVAEGKAEVYSEKFRRRHGLGAASSVQRALTRLIEQDIVESSPLGAYRVPDAFFRAWIARFAGKG